MKQKAQISFEYLLTVAFVLLLVTGVIIVALQVVNITYVVKSKILANRATTIDALMS